MELIVAATLVAAGALGAAILATGLTARFADRRDAGPAEGGPVVLLDRHHLIEANFAARRILARQPGADGLSSLKNWLSQHFDGVATLFDDMTAEGRHVLLSREGGLRLTSSVEDGIMRLTVAKEEPETAIDALAADEDMAELRTLRANTGLSPHPLWRTNAAGEVVWLNQAYLDAGTRRHGREAMRRWPIPHLFDDLSKPGAVKPGEHRRLSLVGSENGRVSWFDCHVTQVDGDLLYTAMNVDDIVQAEGRLREVTQTLTKTFANLTIGLAVFGRQRNLTLFNPALTELTGLPVDFLASRPGLSVFLDRLREERMMPEPKDYKSWRDHLAQLETESVDGTFEETWTLPGGQTWRVTGRPHPDGAIAILFEDISKEMSLTRDFHRELEQSQEVLDSLDDAIAVFGIDGHLTLTNAAYDRLWATSTASGANHATVRDATAEWHKLTSPTPVWGDFRDFASDTRDRLAWSAEARLLDGRRMTCRFTPVSNGGTLACFALDVAGEAVPKEMRRAV